MNHLTFTSKQGDADVRFGPLETFLNIPLNCKTLYVTTPIQKVDVYKLAAWMPLDGKIVAYTSL